MSSVNASAVGFLTVAESTETGFVGGLLVVNALGRPLEFHATTPIRPSRAHEILYGNTLLPFLLGERIAGSLVAHAKTALRLVFTDRFEVWQGLGEVSETLALLASHEQFASLPLPPNSRTSDLPSGLKVLPATRTISSLVDEVMGTLRIEDLTEPFERIREALEEAQKAARPTRRVGEAA